MTKGHRGPLGHVVWTGVKFTRASEAKVTTREESGEEAKIDKVRGEQVKRKKGKWKRKKSESRNKHVLLFPICFLWMLLRWSLLVGAYCCARCRWDTVCKASLDWRLWKAIRLSSWNLTFKRYYHLQRSSYFWKEDWRKDSKRDRTPNKLF